MKWAPLRLSGRPSTEYSNCLVSMRCADLLGSHDCCDPPRTGPIAIATIRYATSPMGEPQKRPKQRLPDRALVGLGVDCKRPMHTVHSLHPMHPISRANLSVPSSHAHSPSSTRNGLILARQFPRACPVCGWPVIHTNTHTHTQAVQLA